MPHRETVFISGPYTPLPELNLTTIRHILKAEECAIWSWSNGYNVICPHLNTRDFHLFCPEIQDSIFLDFYLDILESGLINKLFLLPNWNHSPGTKKELLLAHSLIIPCYEWSPDKPHLTLIN